MQRGRNQVKSEVKEQGQGLMVQIVLRIRGKWPGKDRSPDILLIHKLWKKK